MQTLILDILLIALLSHLPTLHATSTASLPLASPTLLVFPSPALVEPTVSRDRRVLRPTATVRPQDQAPFSYQVPSVLVGLPRWRARSILCNVMIASSNAQRAHFMLLGRQSWEVKQMSVRIGRRIRTLGRLSLAAVTRGSRTQEEHRLVRASLKRARRRLLGLYDGCHEGVQQSLEMESTGHFSSSIEFFKALDEDNWLAAVQHLGGIVLIEELQHIREQIMRDLISRVVATGAELVGPQWDIP